MKHILPLILCAAICSAENIRQRGTLWKPTLRSAGKFAMQAKNDAGTVLKNLGFEDEMEVRSSESDASGRRHVRLRQLYKGVPVDGREIIVHFAKDGSVYEINGERLTGLSLDVEPVVSKEEAMTLAEKANGNAVDASLTVWCPEDDAAKARLAWRISIAGKAKKPGSRDVFVDAITGTTLRIRRSNGCKSAKRIAPDDLPFDADLILNNVRTRAWPEGVSSHVDFPLPEQQGGSLVSINGIETPEGEFLLTSTNSCGIQIGVLDGFAAPRFRNAAKAAFRADNARWFTYFQDISSWTALVEDPDDFPSDAAAISFNITTVLDWWKKEFDWESYDNKGSRVAAWRFWNDDIDELDNGYENAFWMPGTDEDDNAAGCFFFGYDLKGVRTETTLDTCGHELAHGVTSCTADLQYEGEPGALNESFSDILGAAVEFSAQPRAEDAEHPLPGQADWLFDEDSEAGASGSARSLAKPSLHRQPSRYDGTLWQNPAIVSEFTDYGGVHVNSGVQNHFFYLLCEGGEGVNDGVAYSLDGIGVDKGAQIAWRALTAYCGPRTNYKSVQSAWDSAALDLLEDGFLSQAEYGQIAKSWEAVMGVPAIFSGASQTLYTGPSFYILVGKANSKGVSSISFVYIQPNGKLLKVSGKVSVKTGKAVLYSKKLGNVELFVGPDTVLGSFLGDPLEATKASPEVSSLTTEEEFRVGVAVRGNAELSSSGYSAKWSAKKMPSGVKLVSKTGQLAGVPQKAGNGVALISAKVSLLPEGAKKAVQVKVERSVPWSVSGLDAWAQGKFIGNSGELFSISKNGRIAGKGKTFRLSAKSFSSCQDGTYVAKGADSKKRAFSLSVSRDGLVLELGGATVTARRK